MPLWADDNTARLWVKIRCHTEDHTLLGRLPFNATPADITEAQIRLSLAYKAVKQFLPSDFQAVEARFAPFGVKESSPVAVDGNWATFTGEQAPLRVHTAKYLNMVGKGTGRSFTSIKLWGISLVATNYADNDFTASPDEYLGLTAVKAALDGSQPLFVCRNGSQAVFGNTARSRVSAYWQTALR